MSRIGLADNSGSLMSVAWQLYNEGEELMYWTKDKGEPSKIGKGLVPRVASLDEMLKWNPDCIITYRLDNESEKIKRASIPTFGSSKATLALEDKRLFAAELCRNLGVGKVPETNRFTSADAARKFIETDRSRAAWVFKAEGGTVATSSTHVTNSREHLLQILDYEETRSGAEAFILQEKVDGIEISIEGWFDYRSEFGWVQPINSTLERKKLQAGDNGPMTGCMGSIVWGWPNDRPKLFRQTLEKLAPYLRKVNYIGPIDGNFIIDYNDRQPYFLEFTPRFGWNALEAIMAGSLGSFGQFLINFAKGGGERKMRFKDNYMAALRLYTAKGPNVPIIAPIRENPYLYPKDLWCDGEKLLTVDEETIPGFVVILEACGYGRTIEQAVTPIYEDLVPKIIAPDLMYRNDIGEKAKEDIRLLNEWGYITDRDSFSPHKTYSIPQNPASPSAH